MLPPTRVFSAHDVIKERPARPLVALLSRPAETLGHRYDGLGSGQPLLDANSRLRVAKVVDRLGWVPGVQLSARITGTRVVVTSAGPSSSGVRVPLTLDKGMRLTLTPAICFVLGVGPGTQVQAISDPTTGTLTLLSLSEALHTLLGKEAS